ncbi:hypothetical protein LJC01_02235 [Clostridiaceae bacterium OttesenSCG-928-D20]|nr:hypothetical protein [Clostridiaceae bacterium OttesenSCG-928-D20]
MWLLDRMSESNQAEDPAVCVGEVSLSGSSLAVVTDAEHGNIKIASPDGVSWLPQKGRQALVLKTEEGELVVIGILKDGAPMLNEGEIRLGEGSCTLTVSKNGDVSIVGDLNISGNLRVSGNITASRGITVGSNLQVFGNADISNELIVKGTPYRPCMCMGV